MSGVLDSLKMSVNGAIELLGWPLIVLSVLATLAVEYVGIFALLVPIIVLVYLGWKCSKKKGLTAGKAAWLGAITALIVTIPRLLLVLLFSQRISQSYELNTYLLSQQLGGANNTLIGTFLVVIAVMTALIIAALIGFTLSGIAAFVAKKR
jgi:lysylphosphatidylglycerol synthetase-like protein (DUF2156 family)